jgi:ribosomal protein S18 acetylase RimI-like enzyme
MDKKDLKLDTVVNADDPNFIRKLVKHSAVFNEIEVNIAGELAEAVLDGSDTSYKFIFLRDQSGVPVAYSCYGEIPLTDKRYDLYWIVVSPDYQNLGLAKKLIEETNKDVMALGGKQIYAETSGTELYAPARSFYLKNEFTQVARYPDFYRDGDDKVVFVKNY